MTQQRSEPRGQEPPAPESTPSVAAPVAHTGRQGFLPIETNTFDRVFISVVLLIAIHLLWMRLVESFLPLEIATILSVVLLVVIVKWG